MLKESPPSFPERPMTEPFNPYAAPSANLNPQSAGEGCWRDEKVVVMAREGSLPSRCVKCNAPAETPIKERRIYWHHPGLYLLVIFPGLLIYAIVALIVRKKASISPGLSQIHQRKRNIGLALGWIGGLGGPVMMVMSLSLDSCGLGFFGLALFFVGLIAGMVLARNLYADHIDDSYVRLKGAGPDFLASLPDFHG
jgi:hypothetical protein